MARTVGCISRKKAASPVNSKFSATARTKYRLNDGMVIPTRAGKHSSSIPSPRSPCVISRKFACAYLPASRKTVYPKSIWLRLSMAYRACSRQGQSS